MLAVSELVTNAVQAHRRHPWLHGRHRIELMVIVIGRTLRVEVRDGASRHYPVLADQCDDAESGRGLQVVASIAASWGSRACSGGKVVWCDLRLPEDAAGPVRRFDPQLLLASAAPEM